jgi:hypothetical protein
MSRSTPNAGEFIAQGKHQRASLSILEFVHPDVGTGSQNRVKLKREMMRILGSA